MSDKSKIEWCDSTVNFWSGCTKVSAGCANCYAETRDKRHMIEAVDHWGKGAPRLKHVGAVKQAMAFNRKPWICNACGEAFDVRQTHKCVQASHGAHDFHRRRIFSLSLGDWLDDEVPIEWLAEMLDTIRQCDQVTWILCTKRPENFTARLEAVYSRPQTLPPLMDFIGGWIGWHVGPLAKAAPKNVILLASVENQAMADKRIPELLRIPAACRGLSLEPLLGPVEISKCALGPYGISWLIIGGESGPAARACNVEWIRSLVAQGKAAGVATFVKQLGADPRHDTHGRSVLDGKMVAMLNAPLTIKDKKGGDWSEWPADLRVREFPNL